MSGSVKLNLPAGGSKTISAPDSASDETITLPAGTKTLLATDGDGSSLTGISSGANTSLSNLSATGENKVCQAWVNFNGTGTVSISDSYNVSSITDNGPGNYTVNLTSAMSNATYTVTFGGKANNNDEPMGIGIQGTKTTSSFIMRCRQMSYNNNTNADAEEAHAQVFGD